MYGQFLELTLHCSLPLVSTSVFLRKMITHFDGGIGVRAEIGWPWRVPTSLPSGTPLVLRSWGGRFHPLRTTWWRRIYVFLLLPTLMHLLIFRRRLFVRYAAIDGAHIADLLLVPSLTLLLHFAMVYGGYAWWVARLYPPLRLSPPQNRTRRPRRNSGRRRRWWAPIDRSILPELAYAIALLSFQYRYLIPFVTSHQYHPTVDTAADDATSSRQRWKIAFFINLGLLLLTLAPLFRRAGDDRGGGHGGGRPVSIAERMWAWVEEYRRDVVRGTYWEDVYRDDDGSGDGRGEREDGRRLCVGMNDGKIFLLDASLVPAASYSTAHPMDGSRVAIVRADGTVRVWNADRHSLLIFLAHETYG